MLSRASSLWALSAVAGEAEEEEAELGEDEKEEMASMSSGGQQGLFRKEEEDNEIQVRRVPRVNNNEVHMFRKIYERLPQILGLVPDQKDREAGTDQGMQLGPLTVSIPGMQVFQEKRDGREHPIGTRESHSHGMTIERRSVHEIAHWNT